MNYILQVRDLAVERGGVIVLDIPHLDVSEEKILSLIGPNGAGKSSLLLALAKLLKFSRGDVVFKGKKINSHHSISDYRRKISMVFQEPLLFDTTVFENVASGLKIRGMKNNEITKTVDECLDRFGIGHLMKRSARKLSGGEAQRTSLARAFAVKPEIIFLDEPLSSLDPPTRESLMEDLESILHETRTTTVIATHDRMEALRLSDQIGVINLGKLAQIGSPEEIMNHPVDEFVASFVGMETVFTGLVTKIFDGTFVISVAGRSIEAVGSVKVGETVTGFIRPENVVISTARMVGNSSARNVFNGRILKVIPMGLFSKVNIDCGFFLVAYVTHQSLETLSLTEGKDITASFKATAVHVIHRKA